MTIPQAKIDRGLLSIRVRNLQRSIRVDVKQLEKFAARAVRASPRNRHSSDLAFDEISVLLISDRRMAQLHRRFLNQTGPTDVITFQHGEIFISVPTARRQARQFGTSTVREIQLYLVHGLLHLHGYDDRTVQQRRRIRLAEAAVLRRSGV